jgi:hypothetical protein
MNSDQCYYSVRLNTKRSFLSHCRGFWIIIITLSRFPQAVSRVETRPCFAVQGVCAYPPPGYAMAKTIARMGSTKRNVVSATTVGGMIHPVLGRGHGVWGDWEMWWAPSCIEVLWNVVPNVGNWRIISFFYFVWISFISLLLFFIYRKLRYYSIKYWIFRSW